MIWVLLKGSAGGRLNGLIGVSRCGSRYSIPAPQLLPFFVSVYLVFSLFLARPFSSTSSCPLRYILLTSRRPTPVMDIFTI
ncbi:hypothetical protein BDN70DRAFT_153158 [Pholiota conissans]|uniref:Uncharacterized protein n=1 Tax=Pholiota conissans TaxID=109636 RepID=A0A9P6CXN7_9AGAR|nr:hypothetical protein BDN70DRAFT_153158 [Pholiota conissans]